MKCILQYNQNIRSGPENYFGSTYAFQKYASPTTVVLLLTVELYSPILLLANKRNNLHSKQNSQAATDRYKHTTGNIKDGPFLSALHSDSDIQSEYTYILMYSEAFVK